MATSGRRRADLLVDTSVAVPLVISGLPMHASVMAALEGRRIGLAGHAAFETYSVITRLPAPLRQPATTVARVLAATFPASECLPPPRASALLRRFAELGVAGGAVYDGLVGAAAAAADLPLATRDRRALTTYRAVGATVEMLA